MKKRHYFQLLVSALLLSCQSKTTGDKGDAIYFGGPILTMEDAEPTAEAIVVKEGKILFTGKKAEADKYVGDKTEVHDLQGKTLMPGFIDAHGHLTSRAGMESAIDLGAAPYGTVNSIPDLQATIKKYIKDHPMAPNTPLLGNGYDDALMVEHTNPTLAEMDAISDTHPILALHASGHVSVVNSAMFKFLGITETVKDPPGGHYGRDKKTGKLNGRLEENANFMALNKLVTMMPVPKVKPGEESMAIQNLMKAQNEWLKYGQTTICDGRTMGESIPLLKEASAKKLLIADVVYFPDYDMYKDKIDDFKPEYMKYTDRLKLGGFKFSLDGSPQGKTAWLTIPYIVPPVGASKNYKGSPAFTDEFVYNGLKRVFQHGFTAQLHVNGDAAIDQALGAFKKLKEEGVYKPEMRATLIHVQNSRPDHIQMIKDTGVLPSYFSTHVYIWGDWHYTSVFGPQRSQFLSPANSARKAGISFTIHHDAPVTPPDLLTAVYAAVNRRTQSGRILGPDEKITPLEALKAITINAAYQYQEEDRKGSLKVGKLADLVILDQDPTTIDPLKIKDIKVTETIKEGKTVYKQKI